MPLGANKAAIMGVAGVDAGVGTTIALLSTQTASDSASISFTSGITSKYREYLFRFYNINPATNDQNFTFQTSTDGGSNYNLNTTSTYFSGKHAEDDSPAAVGYESSYDFADSTSFIRLSVGIGNGGDEHLAGELHLFDTASTVYHKNFYARTVFYHENDQVWDNFIGGFVNSTSDIDAIQFKMESGNFDGKIKMWGIP